jgi:hypothetical protein
MQDRVRQGSGRLALEWPPCGCKLIQHHARRPKVYARVCLFVPELLRGHVGQRARSSTRLGHTLRNNSLVRRFDALSKPEVQNLQPSPGHQPQVPRLQVAMDHAFAVRRFQSTSLVRRGPLPR